LSREFAKKPRAIAGFFVPQASQIEAENIVLRQQVIVLSRNAQSRVRLRNIDRLIFVWMCRLFPSILNAITVVKPETVIRWHRRGFFRYDANCRAKLCLVRFGICASHVALERCSALTAELHPDWILKLALRAAHRSLPFAKQRILYHQPPHPNMAASVTVSLTCPLPAGSKLGGSLGRPECRGTRGRATRSVDARSVTGIEQRSVMVDGERHPQQGAALMPA
jgi:hypothetical protein